MFAMTKLKWSGFYCMDFENPVLLIQMLKMTFAESWLCNSWNETP